MYSINSKIKTQLTLVANKVTKDHEKYSYFLKDQKIIFTLDEKHFCFRRFNWKIRELFGKFRNSFNVDLNSFLSITPNVFHQSVITCMINNSEYFNDLLFNLKTNKNNQIINNFIINSKYQKMLNFSKLMVQASNFARQLQLMPNNYMNPSTFAEMIKKNFKPFNNLVDIKILNKSDLIKKQMGLILSVGNASNQKNEPKLISIKFKNSKPKFAIVGKGITFDTGGINLKPNAYLAGMQYDMSGAAIAAGVMYGFCLNKMKPDFAVVMPLAVNEIGANCTKVGDVITSYSKKTVEITNTDAEGRLILADGITYAIKDLGVKSVLTIATLTGAIVVALGDMYTGFWSTNSDNIDLFDKAAKSAGEYVWNLPFNQYFTDALKDSMLADLINCVEKPSAGSISAASFLKEFAKSVDFIHLDIAGTSEFKARGKSYPIPVMIDTLFEYVKNNFYGKSK